MVDAIVDIFHRLAAMATKKRYSPGLGNSPFGSEKVGAQPLCISLKFSAAADRACPNHDALDWLFVRKRASDPLLVIITLSQRESSSHLRNLFPAVTQIKVSSGID